MRYVEALIFGVLVCLFAWLAQGCGPNAYAQHATALDVTRTVLDGAAVAIEEGCAARARAIPGGLDGDADALRLQERCRAASVAHGLALVAWERWLDALAIAVAGDDAPLTARLLDAALAALRAYGAIAAELAEVGVSVPSLPDEVAAFVPGGGS